MEYLWTAFVALSDSRPVGMVAGAIPFSEILAYSMLIRPLDTWEVEAIRKIDRAWLLEEQQRAPAAPATKPGMVRMDDAEGMARLFQELN